MYIFSCSNGNVLARMESSSNICWVRHTYFILFKLVELRVDGENAMRYM